MRGHATIANVVIERGEMLAGPGQARGTQLPRASMAMA